MARDQFFKGGSYEWPPLLFSGDGKSGWKSRGSRKDAPEAKETPEEMIRSLQGIFCKGRYRSWPVR